MRTIAATMMLFASSMAAAIAAPSSAISQATPTGPAAAATTTITTTAAGTTVKTTAIDPDSKMICSQTDTLGTRLGSHKVCMTRRQWREQAAENRMAVNRVQTQRASNPNGTGY